MNRNIQINDDLVNGHEEGVNQPPYNNMGAVNTKKGIEALIDWCSFTIPENYFCSLEDVFKILNISQKEFSRAPRGGNGYQSQLSYGEISVFYDGAPGMGYHVSMKGQGCRQYEGLFGDRWGELFKSIFNYNGHFSRLDVATDDYRGCFTVADIEEKVKKREVRCKFRTARGMTQYDLSKEVGQGEGKTVYFGSAQSDIQIRIYDKAAQQRVAFPWVRTEMQLRNERADIMAQIIVVKAADFGKIVSGALRNYINFIEPSNDSNKARWPVSPWWDEFLGCVDKVRLTINKTVKTISDKMEWMSRQMSKTLALIDSSLEGRIYSIHDWINVLTEKGRTQFKPHDYSLLQATKAEHRHMMAVRRSSCAKALFVGLQESH